MKIAIITTVNHNVGDDFVREGIKYLLKKYFSGRVLEFQNIHKHSPITARYGFEWFRSFILSRFVDKILPDFISADRILEADIVVQSGAPVYWCHSEENQHCYRNEWFQPLIRERFVRNKKARLLNLAAGTCQKYYSDGTEFCGCCNSYIKEFYDIANVTTARDSLAGKILSNLSIKVPVIPCSSIFAVDEHNVIKEVGEYVVVNYMKGGAHYTFGQDINFAKWEDEFRKFYFELKKTEKVIFSCHNSKEVRQAFSIDPDAEIFFKKNDFRAYMEFYSKAKYGILNRVHGAFLMASLGKPSVVIGNDTRARMAEEIGLESYFVSDVDCHFLLGKAEQLRLQQDDFSEKFDVIKKKAYLDYMNALETVFKLGKM